MKKPTKPIMNRRDFIKWSGCVSAAAASFPLLPGEFATADVREVLGPEAMARVRVEEAVTLDHHLLLNRGDRFEAVPLPLQAQLALAFDASVADLDGDGAEDVFLSQNFFPNEVNTQRYAAGRGLLLRGDGEGGLTPVDGAASGIRVYGDQRGAADLRHDSG